MLVELGGGTLPHPRADVVIDMHHPKNAPAQDAGMTPWKIGEQWKYPAGYTVGGPWGDGTLMLADNSVDEMYSSHFLEHVHRGQPLVNVMSEAWRVLKPGGTFLSILPLVGYTDPYSGGPMSDHIGWQPWSDPTHVNYWWMPEAFKYFCVGEFMAHADYGIKYFAPLGSYVPEDEASAYVDAYRRGPIGVSFWSVRNTWEGVVCLLKP